MGKRQFSISTDLSTHVHYFESRGQKQMIVVMTFILYDLVGNNLLKTSLRLQTLYWLCKMNRNAWSFSSKIPSVGLEVASLQKCGIE